VVILSVLPLRRPAPLIAAQFGSAPPSCDRVHDHSVRVRSWAIAVSRGTIGWVRPWAIAIARSGISRVGCWAIPIARRGIRPVGCWAVALAWRAGPGGGGCVPGGGTPTSACSETDGGTPTSTCSGAGTGTPTSAPAAAPTAPAPTAAPVTARQYSRRWPLRLTPATLVAVRGRPTSVIAVSGEISAKLAGDQFNETGIAAQTRAALTEANRLSQSGTQHVRASERAAAYRQRAAECEKLAIGVRGRKCVSAAAPLRDRPRRKKTWPGAWPI
jgi:hypothetical protein